MAKKAKLMLKLMSGRNSEGREEKRRLSIKLAFELDKWKRKEKMGGMNKMILPEKRRAWASVEREAKC